jgi:hypothetical protein
LFIGAASAILINLPDVPFRATLVRKWFTEVDDREELLRPQAMITPALQR